MAKRIRDYVKYTLVELEKYTKDEGSCVKKVNSKTHVSFPPHGLGNIHATLLKIFSKKIIGFFDQKLEGIVLEMRNIKVVGDKGLIHFNSIYSHMDIQADFYIFQPQIGSVVKGVIKHVSDRQIGVIIYRVFSVAIRLKEKNNRKLEINSEIEIRIKNFDLENLLPYIEGELILPKKMSGNRFNETLNRSPIENYESIHLPSESSDHEVDQFRNTARSTAGELNQSSDEDSSEGEDTNINRIKNSGGTNELHHHTHKEVSNIETNRKITFEISSTDDDSSDEDIGKSNLKKLGNLPKAIKDEVKKITDSDTDEEDHGNTVTEPQEALNKNRKKTTIRKTIQQEDSTDDSSSDEDATAASRDRSKMLNNGTTRKPVQQQHSTDDSSSDEDPTIPTPDRSKMLNNATTTKPIQQENSTDDSSNDEGPTRAASALIKLDKFPTADIKDEEENNIESETIDAVNELESLNLASKKISSAIALNSKISSALNEPAKSTENHIVKSSSPDMFESTQTQLSPKPNLINNKRPRSSSESSYDSIFERNSHINSKSTQKATQLKETIRTSTQKEIVSSQPSNIPQKNKVVHNSNTKFDNAFIPIKQEDKILSPRKANPTADSHEKVQNMVESVISTISPKKEKSPMKSSTNVKLEKPSPSKSKNPILEDARAEKISVLNKQFKGILALVKNSENETSNINESDSFLKKAPNKRQRKSSLKSTIQDSPINNAAPSEFTPGMSTADMLRIVENFKTKVMNISNNEPVASDTPQTQPIKKTTRKRKNSGGNAIPPKKQKKAPVTKGKASEIINETAALAALSKDSSNRSHSESSSTSEKQSANVDAEPADQLITQPEKKATIKKPRKLKQKSESRVSESNKTPVDVNVNISNILTASKPENSSEIKIKEPRKPRKKPEPKVVKSVKPVHLDKLETKTENIADVSSEISSVATLNQPENSTKAKLKAPRKTRKKSEPKIPQLTEMEKEKIISSLPGTDLSNLFSIFINNLSTISSSAPINASEIKTRKPRKKCESKTKTEAVDQHETKKLSTISSGPPIDASEIKAKMPRKKREYKTKTKAVDEQETENVPVASSLEKNQCENIGDAPKKKTPVRRKSMAARTSLLETSTNESTEVKIPIIQPNGDQQDLTDEPLKKKAPARRKPTAARLSLTRKTTEQPSLDINTKSAITTDSPTLTVAVVGKIEKNVESNIKKTKQPRKKAETKTEKSAVVPDSVIENKVLDIMKQTLGTTDISSLMSGNNDFAAAFISKITSEVKTSLNEDSFANSVIKKPAQKRKSKASETTPSSEKTIKTTKTNNRKSVALSDTIDIKDAPDNSVFLTPKMSSTAVNMRNESI